MAKMQCLEVILCVLMIFPTLQVEAGLNPEKDNVCLKTVTYSETIRATVRGPASKRDTILCLKEGKYCGEEIVIDMKEPRVIVRTKIVPSCCEGYEEDVGGTQCVPVCPNGCGNGKCVAPGKCFCEAGFFGLECDKICDEGRWGENCVLACNCSENELCDKISGCLCKPGWTGDRCATPCTEGYFGFLCQKKCPCDARLCDHITGACIKPEETPTTLSVTEESEIKKKSKTTPSNASVATNQISIKLSNAQDFLLTKAEFATNVTEDESFDKKLTVIPKDYDEAASLNLTYFKPIMVEKEEKSNEVAQTENSTFVYGTNFKPVTDLKDRVRLYETPALHTPQNTKTIDELKELTKDEGKNVFHGNELIGPASDHRSTDAENMQSSGVGNFIPTVSVLSGVSALLLLIAGKWLIMTLQKKVKKMTNVELGCSDEELSILPTDKFIWENNLANPAYVADILRTTPILQTFKPDTAETDKSTENKTDLASES